VYKRHAFLITKKNKLVINWKYYFFTIRFLWWIQ